MGIVDWSLRIAATVFSRGCLYILATAFALASVMPAAATTGQFANPVFPANSADPSVFYKDGYYYYAFGTDTAIWIYKSPTLEGLDHPVAVNVAFSSTSSYTQFWGVEINYLSGNWYLTTSSLQSGNNRHQQVLEATSQDPMGTWTNLGRLTDPSFPGYDIDTTYLQLPSGQLYLLFSGAPTWSDPTGIWIAPLSNPSTVSGSAVQIATPTLSWEGTVNEAPAAVVKNGKVNVTYSANDYQSNSYAIGLLTYTTGNILSAASWTKNATPVIAATGTIYGPGSNCFTKSPDGTEDWIVYHAKNFSTYGSWRHIMAQKFTWNTDNTPNFGTLQAVNVAQNRPSGEIDSPLPSPTIYNAEYATFNAAQIDQREPDPNVPGSGAIGGADVGSIDTSSSYVEFDRVNVPTAGTYKLVIRYSNAQSPFAPTLNLSVNGGTPVSVALAAGTSWNVFQVVTRDVTLNAGNNTIRLAKGNFNAEVDAILLPRQEAEFSKLIGGATVTARSNAVGSYDVGNINWVGSDGVLFNNNSVLSLVAGTYTVSVRYSAGWGTATQTVSVNGASPIVLTLPGTTDWNTFSTATFTVSLPVNVNTVEFLANSGYAEIDSIQWYQ